MDLAAAQSAWKEADGLEFADDEGEEHHKDEDAAAKDGLGRPEAALSEPAASGGDRLCHSPPADASDRAAGSEDRDMSISVQKKMVQHMRFSLKWSHPELHDALLVAGLAVPGQPSLLTYFRALHTPFGGSQIGLLPQSFHTTPKATSKA